MRVVSGSARGTVLFSPESEGTRPTTDRVKENIFNLIQFDVPGKNVLDLFSGSGAMGIEALSRGASSATFVDSSPSAVSIIKKNIEKTKFTLNSQVVSKSFDAFLKSASLKFDLIFLDPPYHKGYIDEAIKLLLERELLKNDAVIVCECDRDEEIKDYDELFKLKEKLYGRVKITVLKKKGI